MTSVATLLFTEPQARHVTDAVAASPPLAEVGASLNLSAVMRGRVAQDVTETLRPLVDISFLEVLVGAWRTHKAIKAAAEADSPAVQHVALASHQVTSAHRPYVEFVVNEETKAVANFLLQLNFAVDSLVASVQSGRLVGIDVARCAVSGSLHFEQVKVAEGQRALDPLLELRLPDEGISLIEPSPG